MRLKLMMSTVSFSAKPQAPETYKLRSLMKPALIDEQMFIQCVLNGHAWMPGLMVGGQTRSNWREQQLIGLDFDNTVPKLDASCKPVRGADGKFEKLLLKPGDSGFISFKSVFQILCKHGISPMLAYESYSSTDSNPRFRVVICLSEPCEDPDVMEAAIDRLLYLFPQADQKCSDLARLFYGAGADAVYVNAGRDFGGYRYTDIRTILRLPERPKPEIKPKTRPRAPYAKRMSFGFDIDSLRDNTDLLQLVQSDTGEFGHATGRCICFHQCPICGHKDCFVFYPDTNSWTCFSSSNMTGIAGGSAIDYVMARDGVGFGPALRLLSQIQ